MPVSRSPWFYLAAFGVLTVPVCGLSGCDSKPSDGTVIEANSSVSPEQKAKVKGFYADRIKAANKKAVRKK